MRKINTGSGAAVSPFEIGDLKDSAAVAALPDEWKVCDGSSLVSASYPDLAAKLNNSTALVSSNYLISPVSEDGDLETPFDIESASLTGRQFPVVGAPWAFCVAYNTSGQRRVSRASINLLTAEQTNTSSTNSSSTFYNWDRSMATLAVTGEFIAHWEHSRPDTTTTSSQSTSFIRMSDGSEAGSASNSMWHDPGNAGGITFMNYDYESNLVWMGVWSERSNHNFNTPMIVYMDNDTGVGGDLGTISDNFYQDMWEDGGTSKDHYNNNPRAINIPGTSDHLIAGCRQYLRLSMSSTPTDQAGGTMASSLSARNPQEQGALFYEPATQEVHQYIYTETGQFARRFWDVSGTNATMGTPVTLGSTSASEDPALDCFATTGFDTTDGRYRFLPVRYGSSYAIYDTEVDVETSLHAYMDARAIARTYRGVLAEGLALDIDQPQVIFDRNSEDAYGPAKAASPAPRVLRRADGKVDIIQDISVASAATELTVNFGRMPASGEGSTIVSSSKVFTAPEGTFFSLPASHNLYAPDGGTSPFATGNSDHMIYLSSDRGQKALLVPCESATSVNFIFVLYLSSNDGETWSEAIRLTPRAVGGGIDPIIFNPISSCISIGLTSTTGSTPDIFFSGSSINIINYTGEATNLPTLTNTHIKVL